METAEKKYEVRLPKQVSAALKIVTPAVDSAGEESGGVVAGAAVKPVVEPITGAQAAVVDVHAGNYEQAYKTLKGKYDADVPAMQRRIRELESELEKRPVASAAAATLDLENGLTEDELLEADHETLAVVRKMIANAGNGNEAERHQLRREVFKARLAVHCPDYAEINRNPEFLAWLEQPQPLTGQTRWDLLKAADAANDADRVSEFFVSWQQAMGTRVPKKDGKEALVVPGTISSGAGAEPQKGKVKASAIANFYLDVTKGRYRNNPGEQARLDAEYKLAIAEGRITDDTK